MPVKISIRPGHHYPRTCSITAAGPVDSWRCFTFHSRGFLWLLGRRGIEVLPFPLESFKTLRPWPNENQQWRCSQQTPGDPNGLLLTIAMLTTSQFSNQFPNPGLLSELRGLWMRGETSPRIYNKSNCHDATAPLIYMYWWFLKNMFFSFSGILIGDRQACMTLLVVTFVMQSLALKLFLSKITQGQHAAFHIDVMWHLCHMVPVCHH